MIYYDTLVIIGNKINMQTIPFLALLISLWLCALAGAQAAEPLRVFVSLLPQKQFVEKVGGEQVEVSVMVKPGHSPATYEPSARQMAALGAADLYIRIGVPFENVWMPRLQAANPHMQIADLRAGIELKPIERHIHDGETHHHDGEQLDPHIWLSPPLVGVMAQQIRRVLSALRPDAAALFAQNEQRFQTELSALHKELQQQLAQVGKRRFMVFHPSWGYFADSYGLQQIPIEREGKSPGPQSLARLIEYAKAEQIGAIFVQRQFNRRDAQSVADAVGARLISVDPLAEDYLTNLRAIGQQFAEALR